MKEVLQLPAIITFSQIKDEVLQELYTIVPQNKVQIIEVQHGLMFNIKQPLLNIIMVSDEDNLTPLLTIKTDNKDIKLKLKQWIHDNDDINSWMFV